MDTSKKIIRGVVNSRGFTITSPITQWDYGWQFIPEIEDLPPTYRLDFSNEEKHGTALPVYCSTDGAEVPTELIDTGKDIWVWYVAIGDGYGITEYKWRIPNKCKPKTEQDEPTPSQQSSIDQLIVRSNEAVEQAEQSASDASTSAQNASADAERAEEARTDAQNYADMAEQARDDAQTYANNASASATASAQSASQSAQIKADVEELERDAQAAANSSGISARASGEFASQAQGFANSASASAQSASGYASQAQTSANTASTKATEASTSAQTASTKASESAQSATNASQSAQTAEQAKTDAQTAQGLAESARDTAVSAKTDAESARDDAESARDEAQQAVASISDALIEKAPVITDTASGSIASFSDGADNLPLKSLIVDINPIQDLSHGDPSPENICPISGWTQIGVEQSGVNVWDEEWEFGYLNINNGSEVATNNSIRMKNYIGVVPNADYYFSCTGKSDVFRVVWFDENKSFISASSSSVLTNKVITAPSGAHYMRCFFSSSYGTTYNHDISINYPSTDHDYHPYTGRSITISLGQTVYGGKLYPLEGKAVIDRGYKLFNGSEEWFLQSTNSYGICNYRYHDITSEYIGGDNVGVICNRFAPQTSGIAVTQTSGFFLNVSGFLFIRIPSTVASTVDEFKTWLADHNVQLTYALKNPITIQLTPNQVNSLLGVNNIWADSGDTTAEYRADTKAYIAKKIAEAIASLT